jgi:lipoyl(octanoyl) transferase
MSNKIEFRTSDQLVEYPDALAFMDARVAGIHGGSAQECVWFLEHPPLYTAGTSAKAQDLLEARFPVYKSGRGGEHTYHGPGQRVAYAMLDLKQRGGADIKKYVRNLEEVIIRTLSEFGIKGERRCGRVGIWVPLSPDGYIATGFGEGVQEAKIAAIGVRVRHWITLHGISINVDPDLSHFGGIVPCGISEHGVTSMKALGVDVSVEKLDVVLKQKFLDVFA